MIAGSGFESFSKPIPSLSIFRTCCVCGKGILGVKVSSYLYAGICRMPAAHNSESFVLVSQTLILFFLLLLLTLIIIVVVAIRHQSTDLLRPRLIVSSKPFQFVFVHSVCNSALFFPPSCCSFSLHVVASLIFVLVSRQLVPFSALLKLLQSFCGH